MKIAKKPANQLLAIVLFLESLAIIIAISGAIAAGHSPKAYFEEGGYMTILSCFQLLGGAFIAKKIFLIVKKSGDFRLNKSSFFWRTSYISLSFLTFDDAFQIHENIDKLMHFILKILFGFEETNISDLADDIIVGGYLLVFFIYVAKEWQAIQTFRDSFIYFKIGCLFTMGMIFFDTFSNNTLFLSIFTESSQQSDFWQNWLGTLEDSLKIYAEGFFLIALYKCWQIAQSRVNPKKC